MYLPVLVVDEEEMKKAGGVRVKVLMKRVHGSGQDSRRV